jgi:hypothetical protein
LKGETTLIRKTTLKVSLVIISLGIADMVFEDDTKLLGLLMRYSEASEIDELKN